MRSQNVSRSDGRTMMIVGILIVALALIAAAVIVGIKIMKKPYAAVYLSTGDIYYGKLATFPKTKLYDAWFLQRGQDGSLGLQKFSDAFWKPIGAMNLEEDKIVFWTEIDSTSPIAEAIEKKQLPDSLKAQAQAQAQDTQGTAPTTGDQAKPAGNTQP